jgi:hypothetical protein
MSGWLRRLLPALALVSMGAGGEPVREKRVLVEERGGLLTMTAGVPELVDAPLREKLRSGFTSTIVLRAYLYREGQAGPLRVTARTYLLSYDLWDEVYLLRVHDPRGEMSLRTHLEAEALERLTRLEAFPLTTLDGLARGVRYFADVLVEVNPISPELLAQVRRWLAHPGGSERLSGGETFFGSFVSVFMNGQVSEAERVLQFRSQPFYLVEPKRGGTP